MKKKRMAKSARKFIRKEKARIRREVLSVEEQKEQIDKLYKKTNYDYKRNLQPSHSNGD
jgi:hypothetical protein